MPDDSRATATTSGTTTTTSPSATTPSTGEPSNDPTQLLAQASQLFADARTALANQDLGTYQDKINQAIAKVEQAQQLLAATSTTTTTTSPKPTPDA